MDSSDSSFTPWFDRRISLYDGVTARECSVVTLGEFLFEIPKMSLDSIVRVRSMADSPERAALKRSLPHATVSGLFSGPHSLDCLLERSSLLCLDIDLKDNPGLDFDEVVRILRPLPYILYVGRSVRGQGVFVIVPVAFPDRLQEHFLSLERAFLNKGLVLDPACKDVTRLRCVSFTESPFVNATASPYRYLLERKTVRTAPFRSVSSSDSRSASQINACVSELVSRHIDITEPYDSWFRIGCALHSELGERGRSLFHAVSSVSEKYDPRQCDLQYDRCSRIGGISIASFFRFCSLAGVGGKGGAS